MSVDYDVRNFKTLDQKKRKEDDYMKMLALQSKMNQQYEEAMQDYEDGLKLDVKQIPPERRSVAEEQADVIFQKQTAFTNAKSIMRDDEAQKFVSGIDLGRAVMFNSNFPDISKRLEGRKDTLTADFLNEFLNRYATLLASTREGGVDTGIVLPLQEPDLTTALTNQTADIQAALNLLPDRAEVTGLIRALRDNYRGSIGVVHNRLADLARLINNEAASIRGKVQGDVTTLELNNATRFNKLMETLREVDGNRTKENAELLKKILENLPELRKILEGKKEPGKGVFGILRTRWGPPIDSPAPVSPSIASTDPTGGGPAEEEETLYTPPDSGGEEEEGGPTASKTHKFPAWYTGVVSEFQKYSDPDDFAKSYVYKKGDKKGAPKEAEILRVIKSFNQQKDKLDPDWKTTVDLSSRESTYPEGQLQVIYDAARRINLLAESKKTDAFVKDKFPEVVIEANFVVNKVDNGFFERFKRKSVGGTGFPATHSSHNYHQPAPANMLGLGMTRVGHTYIMQPKHRRVVGKGIEPAGSTKFKKFGKLIIHIPSLKTGILNIKHPSMSNVKGFPQTYISQNMVDFLLHLLDANEIDNNMWARLKTEEQELLKRAFVRADLDDVLGIKPKVNEDYRKQLKEFELIRGQVIAGNNNHQLLQQLESYVNSFMKQGMMSARDGNEILKEIQQIV